jgi:hypothetical protein
MLFVWGGKGRWNCSVELGKYTASYCIMTSEKHRMHCSAVYHRKAGEWRLYLPLPQALTLFCMRGTLCAFSKAAALHARGLSRRQERARGRHCSLPYSIYSSSTCQLVLPARATPDAHAQLPCPPLARMAPLRCCRSSLPGSGAASGRTTTPRTHSWWQQVSLVSLRRSMLSPDAGGAGAGGCCCRHACAAIASCCKHAGRNVRGRRRVHT